ncbi:hypothetical protein AB0F72_09305 [Actinoplanes sp. NPDC023936]|uniref:hypothetical protein n=1 Tax=Actinoplanes sp. NPDC023936 TaxID=3154910 RepID=UPI00340F834A
MSDNTAIEWADRTPLRVRATAAARIGITLAEYDFNLAAGEKWCGGCRTWEPRSAFAADKSRGDGLMSRCRDSRNNAARKSYVPTPRPATGRRYVEARDGDQLQARRRVNYLVEAALLPAPNTLPCADCGHIWDEGERRHEYDHHLGYAAENHEAVEAVCTTCHHSREDNRRAA